MLITQVSNLFNLIAQNDSELASYAFGFISEVQAPRGNNFDPTSTIGLQFPLLSLSPPATLTLAGYQSQPTSRSDYSIEFYVTDTFARDQRTPVEVLAHCERLAKKVLRYFKERSDQFGGINISDPSLQFDPVRLAQETRSVRVNFTLTVVDACQDVDLSELDAFLSALPSNLNDLDPLDLENIRN